MNQNELQKLIESIVTRVLAERQTPHSALATSHSKKVLIAVCCENCIGDARGQFEELQRAGIGVTIPQEDDLQLTTQRDDLVKTHDILILPSINDAETGKIALGLFDEPHLRLVQAALAFNKPVLASLYNPYDAAMKKHHPLLLRMYDGYRRALGNLGIETIEQAQIAATTRARLGLGTQSTPSSNGAADTTKKLITAGDVEEMARRGNTLALPPGAIITPLARDRAKELGINL